MSPRLGSIGVMFVLLFGLGRAENAPLRVWVSTHRSTKISIQAPVDVTYGVSEETGRIVVRIDGAGLDIQARQRTLELSTLVAGYDIETAGAGAGRLIIRLADPAGAVSLTTSREGRRGLEIQLRTMDRNSSRAPKQPVVSRSIDPPPPPTPRTRPDIESRLVASTARTPVDPPRSSTPALPAAEPVRLLRPTFPAIRSFVPPRIGITGETQLTLHDAIHLALANNPEIEAVRVERDQSASRLEAAKGAYDPVLHASTLFQKEMLPVGSSLGGSLTGSVLNRTWRAAPSVSGAIPRFGGTYEFGVSSQRFSTNNIFSTLNPSYPSAISLDYVQPLGRNLRYDSRRYSIEVARRDQQMLKETFRRRVLDVLQRTEHAYWELSYARHDLDVQLEALAIARKQDEANRRLADNGQLAAIEVVAFRGQVAAWEMRVSTAQDNLMRAENDLKSLTLGGRAEPMWNSALNPVTPLEVTAPLLPLEDAIAEAMTMRPEVAELRVARALNLAGERLRREQLKPQVDLAGRQVWSGLSGHIVNNPANPLADSLTPALIRLNQLSALAGLDTVTAATAAPPPAFLVGGYGRSLGRLFGSDFPMSMVELRVSLPLFNRTAKADLTFSLAEGRHLEQQERSVEQKIEAEIRNAMQSIESARQRLESARIEQSAAGEHFQSEQRRFAKGLSPASLVQQRELNMVAAAAGVFRAETDLAQAIANFEAARGTVEQRHNVVLK